jgi:nicotinamide mononucleotide transporter
VPYPDAATTVLSLIAQLLLTRKHVDNWPVWIFGVNVPYIALYLYKGLALTAVLQLVFIALSAIGWRSWLRELRQGRAVATAATPALEQAA